MEKKLNLKRLIEICLFALTVVFAFLALVFKVYDVKIEFFGSVIQAEGNGFQLLEGYPEALEKIGDWLGVYSIIVIAIIAIEIILYIILFIKKATKLALIEKILVILNVVLALVYMINGFNAKSTIESQDSMYVTETFAFIPFIIVTAFAVAYFVVTFFVKNVAFAAKAEKPNTVAAADELVKYKQLLDAGIISQEEFDAKKKELLGL